MISQTARPAVVLLSGGLDSATIAAIARHDGFDVHALTFRYGQRHLIEVAAAARVAAAAGVVRHTVVDIDMGMFGGSALTDPDAHLGGPVDGAPVTYVPARNTVFLSYALALAETVGAIDLFIGANAADRDGYPDCRLEYLAAFERVARLGTWLGARGHGIRVHAPLISMSKAAVITLGLALGVDYSLTHTCYDPNSHGHPCARCDACLLRARGFAEAGYPDPAGDWPAAAR